MKTLKIITFDVTGTLLGFRQSVGHQYSKISSIYGINVSPDKITDNFNSVFKNLLLDHPNFGANSVGWKLWWKELVLRVLNNSLPERAPLEPDTVNKISSHLIDSYKTDECWKLVDGALDLLHRLKNKNKCLGVLSNYDPRLHDVLKNLNVNQHFDFVLTSYNAKCVKPNLEIFQTVEEMHKNVQRNEILHIGDNPELDFLGAKRAGWNALLISQNQEKVIARYPQIEESWTVKNVDQIYDVLSSKKLL